MNKRRFYVGAMAEQIPRVDAVPDRLFEMSFDDILRRRVRSYRQREWLSARQFGEASVGDRGLIGRRLKRGRSVRLNTADRLLAFMGDPPFGPWFRHEVEAFIAVTGTKACWLGHHALGDPSFVTRLRRGASPRLATVDRVRAWMGAQARAAQRRAIHRAVSRNAALRISADETPGRPHSSRPCGVHTMNTHDSLLSTRQAAAILGLSPRTLEHYRVTGEGPRFRKLGRRVCYAPSDLTLWLESCMRSSTSDDGAGAGAGR